MLNVSQDCKPLPAPFFLLPGKEAHLSTLGINLVGKTRWLQPALFLFQVSGKKKSESPSRCLSFSHDESLQGPESQPRFWKPSLDPAPAPLIEPVSRAEDFPVTTI